MRKREPSALQGSLALEAIELMVLIYLAGGAAERGAAGVVHWWKLVHVYLAGCE